MTLTTEAERVIIRNEPNNMLIRFPCALCSGHTDKQDYLFTIGQDVTGLAANGRCVSVTVCDECARHPENIPSRIRERIGRLRSQVNQLEALAGYEFVTRVVPVSDDERDCHSEASWPNWMRERAGLPPLTECARCGAGHLPDDGSCWPL